MVTKPDKDLTQEEASQLAEQLKKELKAGAFKNIDIVKIKKIITGLSDTRGLLRRTFSESLGLIGNEALPGLIESLSSSPNVIRRRASAKALKLIGNPKALPTLISSLIEDKDPVVQGSCAGAIAIFGEEAVNYLMTVFDNTSTSPMQRGLATWALSYIGSKGAGNLKKAAQSDNPLIRTAAICALEDLISTDYDQEAIDLILEAVTDPISEVRREATRLIIYIKDKTLRKNLLIEKLNDDDIDVRKITIFTLIKLNDYGVIDNLKNQITKERNESMIDILNLAISKIKISN